MLTIDRQEEELERATLTVSSLRAQLVGLESDLEELKVAGETLGGLA